MVKGGFIKAIDDSSGLDQKVINTKQPSSDPFEQANDVSKKFTIDEVKEMGEDEDSVRGGSLLKQSKPSVPEEPKSIKKPSPGKGGWGDFSELDNTDQIEAGSNIGSEVDSFEGTGGGLMGHGNKN